MIIKNSQKIFQSSKMKIIISKIKIIFQNNKKDNKNFKIILF
jgi:hypothetical protein